MSQSVSFSTNQLKFIEWLATPREERSPPTQDLLASKMSINRRTLYRWRQEKALQEAVLQRARSLLSDDLPNIYGALRREAKKGGYQHIKLALEMTGEYDPAGSSEESPFFHKMVVLPPKDGE